MKYYICITILILLKEMKHMIFNEWSLTIFLIGQDGDLGYFIYVGSAKESDTIFSIDLGALGAMEFSVEADDVYF